MSDLANSTNPEGTVFFTMAMGPLGNLEAFAITSEGTLYHNFLTPAGAWGKWEADFLTAPKSVSLSLLMGPTGNLEAFLTGKDKKLYHNYLDKNVKKWHTWKTDV